MIEPHEILHHLEKLWPELTGGFAAYWLHVVHHQIFHVVRHAAKHVLPHLLKGGH